MSTITNSKDDNQVTANISLIKVPTTSNINITFKVQDKDGLIAREASKTFNVDNDKQRFVVVTHVITINGDDNYYVIFNFFVSNTINYFKI